MIFLGRAYLQRHYWDNGKSCSQIARELGTYPNEVRRALLEHWPVLRDASESRKAAIAHGHAKPPMAGRRHTAQSRLKASRTAQANHAAKAADAKAAGKERARARWDATPPAERDKFLRAGEAALRKARAAGSRLERGLAAGLELAGITCELRGPFGDLYLPAAGAAVFVRPPAALEAAFGPQHAEDAAANLRVGRLRAKAAGLRVVEVVPPGRPTLARTRALLEDLLAVLSAPPPKGNAVVTLGGPPRGQVQEAPAGN
jgi:hypothetical protein